MTNETTSRLFRRAITDGGVVLFVVAVFLAVAISLDLAERLHQVQDAHEEWQFDEIILTWLAVSFALVVYSVRRIQDQAREIGYRHTAEQAALRIALHDPLTGLPNRRQFTEAIGAAMTGPPRPGHCHGVFLLDLNGFKRVNDVFGHPAGDELLIRVGESLQDQFGEKCCVARLGGDEFAILATDIAGANAATGLARRIMLGFNRPVEAANQTHFIGVGIGIALSPQDGTTPPDLMRRADIALYRAKAQGGSASCFFAAEMDDHVRMRVRMEHDLRQAIEHGDVVPYYQPIVDLPTGSIVGFEALARWIHPEKGLLMPDLFVPIAEDTALIRELTESIMRTSCRDAVGWRDDILLSVNLSAVLLKDATIGLRILAILAETGLAPNRLEIEITETALVNDLHLAQEVLGGLRQAGVRIALDDFGTGYSSIYHLRNFRFDKIKIDRSYISALGHDSENDAIVRAMMGLGQGLGLTITAEGIEETIQRDALLLTGCQEGQGFLYGKALPAAGALQLLDGGVLGLAKAG